MRSAVYVNEKPVALDRFNIEPAISGVTSNLRLGPFTCMTTFFICKTGVSSSEWEQLESHLADLAEELTGAAQWGVSLLVSDGLIVRGLAQQHSDLQCGLLAFWRRAKQYLYQRDAISPRKVY